MSRKHDQQARINEGIRDVLEDPNTMIFLTRKLIRKKPKYMPRIAWKALMLLVLAPDAKKPFNRADA